MEINMTLGLLGDLSLCVAILLIGYTFLKANINYNPKDKDGM